MRNLMIIVLIVAIAISAGCLASGLKKDDVVISKNMKTAELYIIENFTDQKIVAAVYQVDRRGQVGFSGMVVLEGSFMELEKIGEFHDNQILISNRDVFNELVTYANPLGYFKNGTRPIFI